MTATARGACRFPSRCMLWCIIGFFSIPLPSGDTIRYIPSSLPSHLLLPHPSFPATALSRYPSTLVHSKSVTQPIPHLRLPTPSSPPLTISAPRSPHAPHPSASKSETIPVVIRRALLVISSLRVSFLVYRSRSLYHPSPITTLLRRYPVVRTLDSLDARSLCPLSHSQCL